MELLKKDWRRPTFPHMSRFSESASRDPMSPHSSVQVEVAVSSAMLGLTSRCLDRLGSIRHGMRKRCGMPAELDEATELHSHQKSRRNSRAIAPRTTART